MFVRYVLTPAGGRSVDRFVLVKACPEPVEVARREDRQVRNPLYGRGVTLHNNPFGLSLSKWRCASLRQAQAERFFELECHIPVDENHRTSVRPDFCFQQTLPFVENKNLSSNRIDAFFNESGCQFSAQSMCCGSMNSRKPSSPHSAPTPLCLYPVMGASGRRGLPPLI
ncbi:hypothetical protein ABIE13_000133 [Ottowia thiooxydans]|uniref:Uncharacterized protein n=1 Tax=Ottowia thiooxydans TaxID=219182 RepID=A0ABV2Q1X5_9BURK